MSTDNSAPLLTLPPLSLYVHIPWCVRKCPYCDFNSHTSETIPEQAYVDALKRDLEHALPMVQGRTLQSVFFGGGTPSLFSPRAIETILQTAQRLIGLEPDAEITLEANPGTTEQSRFSGYLAAGINRLSVGVQSFQDEYLRTLGRIHNSEEAIAAINSALNAGFENINIDLMHGLPRQSIDAAQADLKQALALGPRHISWYQLTIEPNTAFYNQPPPLPNDELLSDIQTGGEQILAEAGFQQYEISAYSLFQQASTHNINYWRFGDYIGIGAGAHSKYTDLSCRTIRRQWQTRLPEHYLERNDNFVAGERELSKEELPLEFLMNALRMTEGFATTLFEQRTGLPVARITKQIQGLIERDLLVRSGANICTTPLGRRFLNDVLSAF